MAGTLPDADTLRSLVELACRAPSVHNTQPWRWVSHADRLELWADYRRHLVYADRDGRDLTVSCGSALHLLDVAAAAAGWSTSVRRLPDAAHPHHLASITFAPRPPSEQDLRLAAAARHRHTDRRQVSSWPVPDARIQNLHETASAHGVLASSLSEGAQGVVRDLIARALRLQSTNDAYLDELLAWSHERHDQGVPTTSLLSRDAVERSGEPPTRFPPGSLDDDAELEVAPAAAWIVLATSSDDVLSWLRTGESLMAIWLQCAVDGLSLVPYSQPVEVEATRAALREQLLADSACPQLLLRIGWPPLDHRPPPTTPRHPVDLVLHRVEQG